VILVAPTNDLADLEALVPDLLTVLGAARLSGVVWIGGGP
jgi:hypothetical protein